MKWSVVLLAGLFCAKLVAATAQPASPESLRIPKPRSEYDINHQYYTSLLAKP